VVAYAKRFGEGVEQWQVTALLHDFDWEIHPTLEGHPQLGEPMLAERGRGRGDPRAILSHASHTGVARTSPLEKTLYACDELAAFITAIPMSSRTAACSKWTWHRSREDERQGVRALGKPAGHRRWAPAETGVPLDEHIDSA